MGRKFICECCGGRFQSPLAEGEALAEYHERVAKGVFPEAIPEELMVICDDCDKKLMAILEREGALD